jgi:magnesium-transporting ATPase (P-type)
LPSSALIFAKRSLSLSKIQFVMGIVIASAGILLFNAGNHLTLNGHALVNGQLALLSVSLMAEGILLSSIPLILLYVYDKNNGVLEYLLSLGWNQYDIFKRYLEAALFLALTIFIYELAVNVAVSVVTGTSVTIILSLVVSTVTAALGFSVVSFVTVAMVDFSSLLKQRVGANSPLAYTLGAPIIALTFLLAVILPFFTGVLVELLIAGVVGALSIVLLILSSRLIRREKMLP